MRDQELDVLVAAAGSPRPGQVESLSLDGPAVELRELIMTTTDDIVSIEPSVDDRRAADVPGAKPPNRTRRWAIVGVAAAAATAIGFGFVNPPGDTPPPVRILRIQFRCSMDRWRPHG